MTPINLINPYQPHQLSLINHPIEQNPYNNNPII